MRGFGVSVYSSRQISKGTLNLEVSCERSMSGKTTRLEAIADEQIPDDGIQPYRQEGDNVLKAEPSQDFDQDI